MGVAQWVAPSLLAKLCCDQQLHEDWYLHVDGGEECVVSEGLLVGLNLYRVREFAWCARA